MAIHASGPEVLNRFSHSILKAFTELFQQRIEEIQSVVIPNLGPNLTDAGSISSFEC